MSTPIEIELPFLYGGFEELTSFLRQEVIAKSVDPAQIRNLFNLTISVLADSEEEEGAYRIEVGKKRELLMLRRERVSVTDGELFLSYQAASLCHRDEQERADRKSKSSLVKRVT